MGHKYFSIIMERLRHFIGGGKEKPVEGFVPVVFFDSLPRDLTTSAEKEAKPLNVVSGMATDVGKVRTLNEDSVDISELPSGWSFYQVDDGMGGHAAGNIASYLAVKHARKEIDAQIKEKRPINKFAMKRAIEYADAQILDFQKSNPGTEGMGTTFSGLLLSPTERRAILGNAGDSRIYLLRRNRLCVTMDQTPVAKRAVREGLHIDEIKKMEGKNIIYNALGGRDGLASDPDTYEIPVEEGDVWLLCSDGLWEFCETKDIYEALSAVAEGRNPQETCDRLVGLANDNGGRDNISVVIARVVPAEAVKDTEVATERGFEPELREKPSENAVPVSLSWQGEAKTMLIGGITSAFKQIDEFQPTLALRLGELGRTGGTYPDFVTAIRADVEKGLIKDETRIQMPAHLLLQLLSNSIARYISKNTVQDYYDRVNAYRLAEMIVDLDALSEKFKASKPEIFFKFAYNPEDSTAVFERIDY